MFDEILKMVKDQLGNNPEVNNQLAPGQQDQVHNEVATQITHGLANQATQSGGISDMLESLKNAATSGSPITGAIEGGLVSSLAAKFGLPPSITGAIAGALPGLLQKFAHKAADPTDNSITTESIGKAVSGFTVPGTNINTAGFPNMLNQN